MKSSKLKFEEIDKVKPPSKLSHAVKSTPTRLTTSYIKGRVQKNDDDNVAVKSVYKAEKPITITGKQLQKRLIKKKYQVQKYKSSMKVVRKTTTAVKKVGSSVAKAVSSAIKNPKVLLIVCVSLLIIILVLALASMIATIFQGATNQMVASSYLSEDEDLIATNNNLTALEVGLQKKIANIEIEYPDYDEYRYDINEISHDPHQLSAFLTALQPSFTAEEMDNVINTLFSNMYTLAITPIVETRYDENDEPYNHYVLNVKLTSVSIDEITSKFLTAEQLEMYNVYRQTLGNKPELFN